MSQSIFEQCLQHKREFPDTRRIRMHVDYSEKEQIVIYEYFKEDLLALVKIIKTPDFPLAARKQILFKVGKALQELHAKNWIHICMKLENRFPPCLDFH
jgi:serine/threonine protein kinase